MFRTSLRTFYVLLETQGAGQSQRAVQNVSRQVWRRQFSAGAQQSTRRLAGPSSRPSTTSFTGRFSRSGRRTFHDTARARQAHEPPKGSGGGEAKASQSLSARLKQLGKEYGWTAVGVYFLLSALDYPFFFLIVRMVGTEKIGQIEHYIASHVAVIIPQVVKDKWQDLSQAVKTTWQQYRESFKKVEMKSTGDSKISEGVEMASWNVEEAGKKNREEASLATQLALAYALHKSFIFIRVPLTAAILPSVVKVLRSWGWKVGSKAAKTIR